MSECFFAFRFKIYNRLAPESLSERLQCCGEAVFALPKGPCDVTAAILRSVGV